MANEIDAKCIADKISLAAAKTDEALNNTYKKISILLTIFENIVSSVDDFQVEVGSLNVTLTESTVTSNQMAHYIESLAESADQASESVGDINSKMASSYVKEYASSLSKTENKLKIVAKLERDAAEADKEHAKSKNDVVKMTDAAVDAFEKIISTTGAGSTQISSFTKGVKDLIHSLVEGSSVGSVVGAGISIITTLIVSGIEAVKNAEEKRKKAFEESVKSLEKYSTDIQVLEHYISTVNNTESTTDQLVNARGRLLNTFDDLTIGYTNEGEAILANNEALEKEIELLKKKANLERKQIIANSKEISIEDYRKNVGWLEDFYYNYDSKKENYEKQWALKFGEVFLGYDGFTPDSQIKQFEAMIDLFEKRINAYLELNFELKNSNGELIKTWDDLSASEQAVANSLKLDIFEKFIDGTFTTFEEAQAYLNEMMSNKEFVNQYYQDLESQTQKQAEAVKALKNAYDNLNTAISSSISEMSSFQSKMSSAYTELTENGDLSQSTINSLISTYPQLIDHLNTETGQLDLTEDTMRELYEIQKQLQIAELESAKAKLQQNEETIRSNYEVAKSELELAKNRRGLAGQVPEKTAAFENAEKQLNELEANYDRIDKLIDNLNNTQLDLSGSTEQAQQLSAAVDNLNSSVSKAISGLSGYQSKMSSAYTELTENGKLSQSTINSLISTYPQLIDYLDAETGQLNLTEDTMRNLYEIQKQLQIAELEGAKAKLQQNEDKIKSNYKLAESELLAAQSALMNSGTSQWRIDQYYEKSSAFEDAKKEMEELQASYNRIDTLIETINNTKLDLTAEGNGIKTTTKSVSEYSQALEKLNHQKRMGQLSTKEEIAALEELGRKYVLSADE
ncbi:MAG: hypothetical protein K2J79_01105, partial [Ruminiclostridium sp.]|nr:hypothetical protein [Ruminiclostridium sp.]